MNQQLPGTVVQYWLHGETLGLKDPRKAVTASHTSNKKGAEQSPGERGGQTVWTALIIPAMTCGHTQDTVSVRDATWALVSQVSVGVGHTQA
jgi:hypothetical protein